MFRSFWQDCSGKILLARSFSQDPSGKIVFARSFWHRSFWKDCSEKNFLTRSFWQDLLGKIVLARPLRQNDRIVQCFLQFLNWDFESEVKLLTSFYSRNRRFVGFIDSQILVNFRLTQFLKAPSLSLIVPSLTF